MTVWCYRLDSKRSTKISELNSKYIKFIYLHRSEENKPINLKESENATRILSIHASKGNGCEVVFLFGLNERSLKRFSQNQINIIYESLLHVALTRQKIKLYIGYDNKEDEISKRFEKYINEKPIREYEVNTLVYDFNNSARLIKQYNIDK